VLNAYTQWAKIDKLDKAAANIVLYWKGLPADITMNLFTFCNYMTLSWFTKLYIWNLKF